MEVENEGLFVFFVDSSQRFLDKRIRQQSEIASAGDRQVLSEDANRRYGEFQQMVGVWRLEV